MLAHLFQRLRPSRTCFGYKIGQNALLTPTPVDNVRHYTFWVGIHSVKVNYTRAIYTAPIGRNPFRAVVLHFVESMPILHVLLFQATPNCFGAQ